MSGDPAVWLATAIARAAGWRGLVEVEPPPAGDAETRWRASGLAELTGPARGPPILPERDLAGRLEALLRTTRALASLLGPSPALDMTLFTERAADLGLNRRGVISANGSARMLRCADGWAVANLARPEDLDLFDAWIGAPAGEDPWATLGGAARGVPAADLVAQGRLLGLPVAEVGASKVDRGGAPRIERWAPAAAPRDPNGLRVVDLSGLWAGPLCGRLFVELGARVTKVESTHRPDGARLGPPAFFERMNAGKDFVSLDFSSEIGRTQLTRLIAEADVVIEASRPRALAQLGIDPAEMARARPALVWISLTAYGRTGPWSNAVGFGDDCAAAAGLTVAGPAGEPMFVGDALADPIAGLMAASAGFALLAAGGGGLADVALREAARFVAQAPVASARAAA